MLKALKNKIKDSRPFRAYLEHLLREREIEQFLNEAEIYIESHNLNHKVDILNLYLRDLKKYMFTFNEWFCQYKLYGESEIIKESFISRSEAQRAYRAIIKPEWRTLFHDKRIFATIFQQFIKRRILEVTPPHRRMMSFK